MTSTTKTSKLSAMASAVSTKATVETTKLNLYTLPCEVFVVSHGRTTDNKSAKVILEQAIKDPTKGTIQVFAPFGQDEKLLAEFEEGAVIDGSKAQEIGLYFQLSGGSNYKWLPNPQTATQLMELTGQNSSVMEFPLANKKFTREELQTVKNINSGNVGKVAVATNHVATWLGKAFN
jgi:hypothetical protein